MANPEPAGETRQDVETRIVAAYWPLHRSVLLCTSLYYIYVTAAHFSDEHGLDLALLAGASAATAVFGLLVLMLRLRGWLARPVATELSMAALALGMLANVVVYQLVHYEPAKLVYFPLVAMAASLSATTNRAAVVTVLGIMASMLAIVASAAPATLPIHVAIAIATGLTTIGFAVFLRGVIAREVAARLAADAAAEKAVSASRENSRLAQLDMLTALPNRRGFFDMVQAQLSQRVGDPAFALGVLDLDGFKAVNDVFGHAMGDRVLREVAARVSAGAGLQVRAARLGGDEFGLLVTGMPSDEALARLGRELSASLQQPFRLGATSVRLSGSLGFTRARRGDTIEAVLDRADYAAYEAKSRRRGSAVIFAPMHEARIVAERQLERAVLEADFEREIRPVFQPVVDITSGLVIGYEALARWHHLEMGEIGPSRFIPMAERLGIASRITEAMARKVLAIAEQLPPGLRVSMNLSAHDLASSDAMNRLAALIAGSPQHCHLDFEVTETAVMHDVDEASAALLVLLGQGSRIALDDFGTGHSSLSRVQRLPLDCIKVDRSFVADICEDRASEAIVRTTLDLCRNLGVSCVLEGVETEAQRDRLVAMGARYFQGYLFGRPVAAEVILGQHRQRLTA